MTTRSSIKVNPIRLFIIASHPDYTKIDDTQTTYNVLVAQNQEIFLASLVTGHNAQYFEGIICSIYANAVKDDKLITVLS